MCGIIGIVAQSAVNKTLVSTLKALQHRGQHAAGVATMNGNFMHLKKVVRFSKRSYYGI
jgi:amidophosphoribosyltransferase